MASDDAELPREIAGYALEEKIARGRAGLVFRARDPEGKTVALRTFGARLEPLPAKAQERLEDVYKRLDQVMHAAVPKVLDQGDHEGRPFFVFQHAAGERLDRILDEQRLATEQVLALGKTLADALTAAHTVGLIHTDVCARAVVLGKEQAPMLLGWSAARPAGQALGKDVPRSSQRPPDGEAPDAPALAALDVFGLGALLYEALAYAPPRPADPTAPPLLRAAWPVRRLNPTLSAALDAVIAKAIDPDPRARYASAAELAQDLAAVKDGRRPRALDGRRGRALARAARRQPLVFVLAALALAVVVGVLAASVATSQARGRRVAAAVTAVKSAVAKGALDRAEGELSRARDEDASSPLTAEAAALVEHARAAQAHEAASAERDAAVMALDAEARDALAHARERRKTLASLEENVRLAALTARPLDAPDGPEKRALQAARSALEAAARDEARALGEALQAVRKALALDPTRAATSALLVEVELERIAQLEGPRSLERELRAFAQGAITGIEGAPRLAHLSLAAEPEGARAVLVDATGASRSLSLPAELDTAAGAAQVTFSASGLAPQEVALHLEPGRTTRVKIELVPDAPSPSQVAVPGIELALDPAPLPLAGTDVARAASALVRIAAPPVSVAPALVAKQPVSCRELAAFLREKGGDLPADDLGRPLAGSLDALEKQGDAPATGVTLEQARAYAEWKHARLPRRGELWAARARGAEGAIREWTDGPEGPLVLDLRVDREVVGEERVPSRGLRAEDLGFRLVEGAR